MSDCGTEFKGNILLTGAPGIGKTTVMVRLAELLADRAMAGFYTEEIRKSGQRQGFRAVTFSGQIGVLAHIGFKSKSRVGRYGVDVAAFEQLVMPELSHRADLILIDEIGKMECYSSAFVTTVRDLLNASTRVVATVAVSGGGFIAEVKARPDVQIWKVGHDNRDRLPRQLADLLSLTKDRHN